MRLVGRLAAIPVRGHLLQILDPAEALLPYSGRVRFLGLEREETAYPAGRERAASVYAERLQAHQRGLATICAAAGFTFGVHRTDHRPETALLGLYTALAAR